MICAPSSYVVYLSGWKTRALCPWEGGAIPCLRNDDVVEGGVAFAEAGEADLDDHYIARVVGGRGVVDGEYVDC